MRSSGILMHISSLPNRFGIGSFGKEAYDFVDFLENSGQRYWQILPLGHTSYGDSPYQCFSAFAGNPHFINLDILCEEGLLEKKDYENENFGDDVENVDYGLIFNVRNKILKCAYKNFNKENADFLKFLEENKFWLEEYSLYMAIKESFKLISWKEWAKEARERNVECLNKYKEELKEEINYYKFLQFEFFKQWYKLKQYANEKNIYIIGDLPIYVAEDSADMWGNPKMFKVDENNLPTVVAGCPPDAFSEEGQLWGNPIYNWEEMKKDGFSWWILRIKESLKMYDTIRIDHFRGFESFWQIPYGDKTAINGEWVKGPGVELFDAIEKALGKVSIIAEDLGFMTKEVIDMREKTGFPGMRVLQFAFGGNESQDLPHNYEKNTVAYTGTHDNNTVLGWTKENDLEKKKANKYLEIKDEDYSWKFIRGIWASVSNLAIGTMQDFLEIGEEGRMNTPSTLGINWMWRMKEDAIDDNLSKKILEITELYGRKNG